MGALIGDTPQVHSCLEALSVGGAVVAQGTELQPRCENSAQRTQRSEQLTAKGRGGTGVLERPPGRGAQPSSSLTMQSLFFPRAG